MAKVLQLYQTHHAHNAHNTHHRYKSLTISGRFYKQSVQSKKIQTNTAQYNFLSELEKEHYNQGVQSNRRGAILTGNPKEIAIIEERTIRDKIYEVRGMKVMLDFDLAEIYGYSAQRHSISK